MRSQTEYRISLSVNLGDFSLSADNRVRFSFGERGTFHELAVEIDGKLVSGFDRERERGRERCPCLIRTTIEIMSAHYFAC